MPDHLRERSTRASRRGGALLSCLLLCLAAPATPAQGEGPAQRPPPAEAPSDPKEPVLLQGRIERPAARLADVCAVVARGDGGIELARAAPAADGAFELALPAGCARAIVDVDSRYLHAPTPLRWRRGEPAGGLKLDCADAGELLVRFAANESEAPRLPALDGARLRLLGLPKSGSGFGLERAARIALEDGAPVARWTGLDPDQSYELEAAFAPWVPFRREELLVAAATTTRIEVRLLLGATVRGRVVDERGAPVADARIDAFADGLLDLVLALPGADRLSASDGGYEIAGVPAGALRLAPVREGYIGAVLDLPRVEAGRVYERTDLVLRDGAVLWARVLLPDGSPASLATLRWSQKGAFGIELLQERAAATGADGRVRLSGLADRPVDLSVELAREETRDGKARRVVYKARAQAAPGRGEVELRLAPTWTLRGHVVDDTGRAVQRFTVAWTRGDVDPAKVQEGDVRTRQVRSQQGDFEIEGLEEGPWRVWVLTRMLRSGEAPRVELPQYSGTMVAVLSRRAKISGTVHDAQGAPASNALVEARWMEPHVLGAAAFEVVESVRVAPDGRFELDACGPGKVLVSAGLADGSRASVEVDAQAAGEHKGLQLRAGR